MKTIQATFDRDKNYYLSYKTITRACFRMLNAYVSDQFKVSNNPTLMGWNSAMSIINILIQLQVLYGKPNMMTLYTIDTLFCSLMTTGNSPKMLFYRIEECQEIQRIGNLPYSEEQIIANAVRILLKANIFPLKKLDAWEAVTPKTYPALKTFIHAAYGCRLTALALCSTSGQNGYANQMIYNVLEEGNDEDTNNNTVTTITQTAALTTATGGTTPSGGTAISAKVAATINQLSANQTAIMPQMAAAPAQMVALAIVPPLAQNARVYAPREQFYVPPIQQIAVPMQQPFSATGAYPAGQGGQRGGRGRNQGGHQGGYSRMPFADAMQGTGATSMMTKMMSHGGGIAQPPLECNSGAKNWISPTSIKYTTIGLYASVVVLTSKTGTRPSHAPSNGGTTRICSHAEMHNSSLQRDTIRAQKVCTRRSYQLGGTPDGVGQRVMD
jgi:hypothetical protein